jgi:hypothetical protein
VSSIPQQDPSDLKKLTEHDVYTGLHAFEVYALVPMEGGGFSRLPQSPTGLHEFTIIVAADAETARLSLFGRYKDHGAINAYVQKDIGEVHVLLPKGAKPIKIAPAKPAPATSAPAAADTAETAAESK